ncbi:MAG: ComEC/Rec2 family competence protein, partial [Planctomycetes bacterium]|nr:ComEC/Rec2 family competence protein [Planctomycetota bacterium]
ALPGRVERELQVGARTVRASFPPGLAAPCGATLVVIARARADRLEVHAVRGATAGSLLGLLPALRTGTERALAGRAPGRGLLRAVLLGDRSGLDPQLRRAFRDTGCAHLLSISGLHVGVVLAWALWLGRRWRSGLARRLLFSAALVGYVALVGARPPILRAAVAAAVFVWAPGRGDPLNRLSCAGVVVLLYDPLAVTSVGFSLSFGTVAALLLLAPRPASAGALARGLVGVFAASTLMLAVRMGHLPWINLALGAPCVALLGLILPLGLLGCAGALALPAWGPWLLAPADAACEALVALVRAGAATGAWSWVPLPKGEWAALGLGLLFLAGVRRKDGRPWRPWLVAGACALALGFCPAPPQGLRLRLTPRRDAVFVADGARLVVWGASEAPGRRERAWRSELGRAWRCVRLPRGAGPRVDTEEGEVWIVDRAGVEIAPQRPVAVLVVLRRLPRRELARLLERARPRAVWAPAALGPAFAGRGGPVFLFASRGAAELQIPPESPLTPR